MELNIKGDFFQIQQYEFSYLVQFLTETGKGKHLEN
jgi:hypothetical protein